MSLNKAMLIGNLGGDPDIKMLPSGSAVATLSVATNESYTDKSGQRQDHTEWHRVVLWGKVAEACGKYLRKGSKVYVEGSIRTRSWEDNAGQKRYTTEISGTKIDFLDSKNNDGQGRPPAPQAEYAPSSTPQYGDEDVPF
jgi:single-strand DNA-binding protein